MLTPFSHDPSTFRSQDSARASFCGNEKIPGRVGARNTVVLTALFYTSYHLITTVTLFYVTQGLLLSSAVLLVGVFWASLRIKYESIIPAVISHLLADLGLMLIYLRFLAV